MLSWPDPPADRSILAMTEQFIPDDVVRFVLEKIDSVAQLEGVLLLRGEPRRRWSAAELAARLYINEAQTTELLLGLSARGLVAAEGDPALYSYQPGTPELRQMLDRLAEVYTKQLVAITNLIHSKQKPRVQAFADAFRLRKDD